MTAESAEIRFECSQCGQSIAVDSSGAGLHTHCPTCENPLVVPSVSSLHGRSYGGEAPPAAGRTAFAEEAAEISAAEVQDLRDELGEARRRGAEGEGARVAAEKESAQLQQQLRKAREDGAQRAAAVEAQLGEARAVIAQLGARATAVEETCAQWEQAFAQTAEQAHAYETQMTARETELTAGLAAERAETAALAGEGAALRQQLASAQAGAVAAAAAADEKLAAAQRALEAEEADRRSLAERNVTLRVEVATLRNDLSEIHTGRELLALRDRFATLETEHQRATAALARSTAEAQALTALAAQLRTDLTETRERGADAERRADAASESALKHDNEVLRGIIERQNAVGEERYVELRRLRRARLTLRIIYAASFLALIALAALALGYLPDAARHFLQDWFGL